MLPPMASPENPAPMIAKVTTHRRATPDLAPYRLVHFVVLAFFLNRFLQRDWRGLEWPIFRPLIKCSQQSLEVFCVGVFLAVGAHVVLVENLQRDLDADRSQCRRYRLADRGRLLPLLVQEGRQANVTFLARTRDQPLTTERPEGVLNELISLPDLHRSCMPEVVSAVRKQRQGHRMDR
jgi:hypothetical protein